MYNYHLLLYNATISNCHLPLCYTYYTVNNNINKPLQILNISTDKTYDYVPVTVI